MKMNISAGQGGKVLRTEGRLSTFVKVLYRGQADALMRSVCEPAQLKIPDMNNQYAKMHGKKRGASLVRSLIAFEMEAR